MAIYRQEDGIALGAHPISSVRQRGEGSSLGPGSQLLTLSSPVRMWQYGMMRLAFCLASWVHDCVAYSLLLQSQFSVLPMRVQL